MGGLTLTPTPETALLKADSQLQLVSQPGLPSHVLPKSCKLLQLLKST